MFSIEKYIQQMYPNAWYSDMRHVRSALPAFAISHNAQGAVAFLIHSITVSSETAGRSCILQVNAFPLLQITTGVEPFTHYIPHVQTNTDQLTFTNTDSPKTQLTIHYQFITIKNTKP